MDRSNRSVLLDEVKSYLPSRLRSSQTLVTRVGGSQLVEKKDTSGRYFSNVVGGGQWFVSDFRPDLQVGLILPGLLLALSFRMVLLGAVVLLACTLAANGRYLPTRADDSRHEQIKELLRTLLEMSDDDSTYGRPIYPYDYREDGFRAKRSPSNNAPRQAEEA